MENNLQDFVKNKLKNDYILNMQISALSDVNNTESILELKESFNKIQRGLNGMINTYNELDDSIVREVMYNSLMDFEVSLLKKGIILLMSGEVSTDRIPRIEYIKAFKMTKENVLKHMPNFMDVDNWLYELSIYHDITTTKDNKEGFFTRSLDLLNYEYDEKEERKYLHGSSIIIPEKYYNVFKNTLTSDIYINKDELIYNPGEMEKAVAKEKDFVGMIIYADENILRIRSKSSYHNYTGVEDYIYRLGINKKFDKILMDNFIYPTRRSIPYAMSYIRPRLNYLNKVYLSRNKDFSDPKYIWR